METNRVVADLTPGKKPRIAVFFKYDEGMVKAAKSIKGFNFVNAQNSKLGGPYWSYPLELRTARLLRQAFPNMELGKQMKQWGYRAVAEESNLGKLAIADTAELTVLPEIAPDIYNFIKTRPYQLADVAWMAAAANPVNANAPGGGKTIETIASVFESGSWNGPQLILAPVTSMEIVWADELLHDEHGQDMPVIVASGDKLARDLALMEAQRYVEEEKPFWLICNPQMAQCKYDEKKSKKLHKDIYTPVYPQLFEIEWKNVIVDEFHKCGMGNPNTITRRGLTRLHAERRVALSGTPMGGKTAKLWGVLNWCEPDKFNSKWRWFEHYLNVNRKKIHVGGGVEQNVAEVGEIRNEKYAEFYSEHAAYMVRRTIREMRKELPEPIRNNVWVDMGPAQKKQYEEFALKAELKIEDEQMNAIGILAEYTRLRQFAIAQQELKREQKRNEDGEMEWVSVPYPLGVSCKFDQVYRILDDHGVTADDGSAEDSEKSQEQVIIFSQFTRVVNRLVEELHKKGISAVSLTGQTPQKRRTDIVRDFEDRKGAQVLVMNTTAGGVAITLNESDAIIMLDETWVPDDTEQAERRNRENTAVIYYIRTKDTIEEYILKINQSKRLTNAQVLDIHRMSMKAVAT